MKQGEAGFHTFPERGAKPSVQSTPLTGVTLHTFPVMQDSRGKLTVGEFESSIPFAPLRYFMVYDVPDEAVRGAHAHRECHQFLICVQGSCVVMVDDGLQQLEVPLGAANHGIYLPPLTWAEQHRYSANALLLAFASHRYDPSDYIRDHAEFLALSAKARR
jgi:UDP-2-acetamido-3-amino-2,3-dideoxy-glucuronate N-acetyltransferase